MRMENERVPGRWYKRLDRDQAFMVVAGGDDDDTVRVEFVDGTRTRIDNEEWDRLDLQPIEQPTEWVGRPEDLEPDDLDHGGS